MTRLACAFAMVVIASSTVAAQSEQDAIRGHVKDGQKVSITDSQGNEINGRIHAITSDGLSLVAHGKTTDVPYDKIVKIDRPHDGLANGTLIGLATGAAIGLLAVANEDSHDCGHNVPFCGEPNAALYAAGAIVMGGLGAAAGVTIDALIHRKRQIYRRAGQARVTVAPALRHSSRGAVVSVSW